MPRAPRSPYDAAYRPVPKHLGASYNVAVCRTCDARQIIGYAPMPTRCWYPGCRSHRRRRALYRPGDLSGRAYALVRANVPGSMISALRTVRRTHRCDLRTAIAHLARARRWVERGEIRRSRAAPALTCHTRPLP